MNDTPTPRTDAQTFNQEGKRPTGEEGEVLSVPVEFARDLERQLAEATAWRPIETAPICTGINNRPQRCLVWSPRCGIQMGQAFVQDGEPYASADGFNGEWGFTHWQPLPNQPTV